MQNIEEFLKRFKLIPNPLNKKKELINIINKNTGLDINTNEIKVEGESIYINTHPLKKNIIFTKKSLILRDILDSTEYKNIKNIL